MVASIEKMRMMDFTEQAYLNYSMYVILDRALPYIGDGLKPVQRRIVYAMSDLGLHATAKYKKSARTVGDVLGKFHPHGDSACYEAMVLMAQPFSYRYPLVDGQGNWGAPDEPKSFAAMRYTESRLTHYSELLLAELTQGTVDWGLNFDGTLREPKLMPARVPNVLLNGGSGIAVGMSTDIPPHNLVEVVNACVALLDDPNTTLDQLCEHIQGPDYPTEGEVITSKADLKQMYATGHGSVRQRSVWHKEDNNIIVTALPFQASGSKILEQMAAQMAAKKLPMIIDLRDESDQENPTRLVIEQRSNRIDTEALMQHVFATTDLEKSYRVNLNMISLEGAPKVYNLRELLVTWLEFRQSTVRKRLSFRLDKILDRLHVLEGLLACFIHIDEVIRIIRNEDKPRQALMAAFDLSERQAESILELRLRQIAKLEEIKIRDEQEALAIERDKLEALLGSKTKLLALVRSELLEVARDYGDERKSPLVQRDAAKALEKNQLVPSEAITVVLSEKGWIRAAKGHDIDAAGLNYKTGDGLGATAKGKTTDLLSVLDSDGRSYSINAFELPSARGLGEPLTGSLNPAPGVHFSALVMGLGNESIVLSTNAGFGFVTTLADISTRSKAGKVTLKLTADALILPSCKLSNRDDDWVAVITNLGRLLIFTAFELPLLSRGKGVKMINIPKKALEAGEEFVTCVCTVSSQQALRIHSGKRHLTLKPSDFENYVGQRAQRGKLLPRGFQQPHWAEAFEV